MAPIATSLTQLIGNTPMLEPVRYLKEQGCSARLLLKLECFNPLGSVKDRLALGLIEDAEQQGLLKPGGVIIEPTGGECRHQPGFCRPYPWIPRYHNHAGYPGRGTAQPA